MVIDKKLLDELSEKARKSERLRMNLDLRDTDSDGSQRMLNAIEPGTIIPVHRHTMTSEDVIVLRGRAEEVLFDENGKEVARYLLLPGGEISVVHVPMGQYHTCRSLESGTVIIEFKNGKYNPSSTEDVLEVK